MTSKANIEALREALEAWRCVPAFGKVVGKTWGAFRNAAIACGMSSGCGDPMAWATRFLTEHKESGE